MEAPCGGLSCSPQRASGGLSAACSLRCAPLGTLAEVSLKGNRLDDRAALSLCEALRNTTSLTRVDLSYNHFGEAAGRAFGEVLQLVWKGFHPV